MIKNLLESGGINWYRYAMEQFDLIDENDDVVGITDRETAHETMQPHRVVAVFVFNEVGELYIQVHKKSNGRYDHSVGGHVRKGETYAEAANREAEEELGIKQKLNMLSKVLSNANKIHMFCIFECVADKSWKFIPNEEVEEIIPMKINDIRTMMIKYPEKFTTGFKNTMAEYCRIKGIS